MPAPTTTTTPTALAEAEAKEFANLQACLALRGHSLARLASGEYLVIRGAHSKFCRTLCEVEQFCRLVGAIK